MKVDVIGLYKLMRDMLRLRAHDRSEYFKLINMPLEFIAISLKE